MSARFWLQLGDADRAALEKAARRRNVEPGGTLFASGDEPTSFAVVLTGRVKLVGRTPSGRDVLIGMRSPGDIIGEMGAIDGRPRSVDVVAVDPVEVLVGEARVLQDFLQRHPAGWAAVCRSLSERLRESDHDRMTSSTLPGEARVAVRLVALARRYGRPTRERDIILPLTQNELADWTGLSRPTIARALAALRAAGLVRTARGRIVILDTSALAAYQLR